MDAEKEFERIKSKYENSIDCTFTKDIKILIRIITDMRKRLGYKTIDDIYTKEQQKCLMQLGLFEDVLKGIDNVFNKQIMIPLSELEKLHNDFITVRNEIIREQDKFNRPMMTYDLVRNDYCESMIYSLIKKYKEEK